jgi:hypothetical protein
MICSPVRVWPVRSAWSRRKPVPEIQVSRQPLRPHQQAGPGDSSGLGQGRGVCPHSPATPLAPSTSLPSIARPPPQPVPMITANTPAKPAAAPSTASDRARQLASLASRTGRPRPASRSSRNRRPFSQVELALRITPVRGDTEPGAPTPIEPRPPACCSAWAIRSRDRGDGGVVGPRIGGAHTGQEPAVRRQGGGLDLRAAKIHADLDQTRLPPPLATRTPARFRCGP